MHNLCYADVARPTALLKDFFASGIMFDGLNNVLTIRDLCSVLRIGKNTAYDLVNSGQIKSVRIKNRIRIPKQFLIQYVLQNSEQFNTG